MDLRALRSYIAVVEAGSLTAAAAALRLSQPSLSVAIAKLEAELGVALLVRSPRGVEPTSAGRYLLDASSRLLGEVDEITRTLQQFGAGVAGSLTLAAVPVLMWHRVPELLRTHARTAPGVSVQVVDPPPWSALDLLQQGRVDAAAVLVAEPERFARRHRGQFEFIDWGEVPVMAVRPLGDEQAAVPVPDPESEVKRGGADPLPLAAFSGEHLLLPRQTAAVPSLPEVVTAALHEHGVTPLSLRTVETIQNIVTLIEAGLGSALLPNPGGESLRRFRVRVERVHPEPEPLRALVAVRAGGASDAVLAKLLEEIVATPGI